MQDFIYFDNSATTRIRDEALDEYVRVSQKLWGNPSSLHSFGFEAERVIESAREKTLACLGAKGGRIIFTSSGSEANNLAIFGRALSKERYFGKAKIITTLGEHASVSEPIKRLCGFGFKFEEISTRGGEIDFEQLKNALTPDTVLVTVMMVNNETGALYDVKRVGTLMRALCPDALLHVDATQSFMKVPFTPDGIGADMVTVSSHKIEGPKGIGALYINEKVVKAKGLAPLIYGGGQEGGMRSGTENAPAIAAFGVACDMAKKELAESTIKLNSLREYLIEKIENTEELKTIKIAKPQRFAPHIVNITLQKIRSETVLHFLSSEGIYVSSGSACSSNSAHHSSALTAFGHTETEADSSIRISLTHRNTKEQIDRLIEALIKANERLAKVK